MSLWPSTSLSSFWLTLAVLTIVFGVMQSGCNAATAAEKRQPTLADPPKISSVEEMRITVAQVTQRLQRAERSLAPLKTCQKNLTRKFTTYSARTARHGWHSIDQQQSSANTIRHDASMFKAQLGMVERSFNNQFGRSMAMLQSPAVRRFARDAPTKHQLAQSAKIYKRILELLQNMIECPVHILEFLGEDSEESAETVMPPEEEEPITEQAPFDYNTYDY